MTAVGLVYDALMAAWIRVALQVDLDVAQVLDGPPVTYVSTEGVAVGATVTDTTAQIVYDTTDLRMDQGENTTAPFLIWAGSGDTTFKPLRDRVNVLAVAFRAELASDRRLGGVVTSSRIVSGVYDQQQTGQGALVLFEQRLQYRIT